MARDWPAAGHRAADRARRRSRATVSTRTAPTASRRRRPAPSSICACSASRRSAATRSATSCRSSRPRSPTISTSCARARASWHHQGRTGRSPRRLRDAAQDPDPRLGRRRRRRGPDPARGHGRHRVPCRLHQARAALDLPGAAPRRQGPRRHGDPRRGFRHPPVRGQHAHAGPVLLVARARPTRKRSGGCRSRRRTPAARRWSTCCRSRGRAHHHHHAAARGRGVLGASST